MKSFLLILIFVFLNLSAFAQFSHESELGVVVTGGNTEMEVYNGKVTNKYQRDTNTFTLGGHYTYGTSFGVENSRNWDVNAKAKHDLTQKVGIFLGSILEADEFAGIQSRINVDVGGTYQFLKTEKSQINTELGYRYRREKNLAGTTLSQSQGRLYVEGKRSPSKDLSMKLWAEYLPNFTKSEDWQLNFEPSFQFNLNSTLALKWGYLGRYDNDPVPGNKKFDFLYVTSLLAKF
ncbi:MAG: DUF481 domain-containing protein [Bacteriovoracaceae bacterium]|nr:DUF481 domain-containing protein [Bacteriovoracaceae bacterium]